MKTPTVSIVTPSFKQPEWLRLCLASVADQQGVNIEHIVQDNNSGPEVEGLASKFPHAQFFFEEDKGMYDAINHGLRRSRGEICAYLNCDEQYLPGTLAKVVEFMRQNPDVDMLFGDAVVHDPQGNYVCSRQVLRPLLYHTKFCQLNTLTAATFFRRRIFAEKNLYFDSSWRNIGDAEWIVRAIRSGIKMAVLRKYLAAFTDTGENLNLISASLGEEARLRAMPPSWPFALRLLWIMHHRLRRLAHGLYRPRPFFYSIYTAASPEQRIVFDVDQPEFLWKSRLKCPWSPRSSPKASRQPNDKYHTKY